MTEDGKELLKVLYCDSPVDLGKVDESIRRDVFSLLDRFKNIQLEVKPHPRYPKTVFPLKHHERLTFYGREDDINVLMVRAGAVITSASTLILQSIVELKPTIFYDTWREMMNFTGITICDDTKAVLRASNPSQLYEALQRVMNGWRPKYAEVNQFYKLYISNGIPLGGESAERLYHRLCHSS